MTLPDRVLRQYLAGALDPPDLERVERALGADPGLRVRLGVLLATTVQPGTTPAPGRWVVPPPSLPVFGLGSPLRGTAAPVGVMDASAPDVGWVVLRLDVPAEHLDHRVVVLERGASDWSVVFPTAADELHPASALPREQGQVRIDVARPTGGPGSPAHREHRIAVVLVPPPLADDVDWSLGPDVRWGAVIDAAADGALPIASFDVGR